MALSDWVNASITNDEYIGCIRIVTENVASSLGSVGYMEIYRRDNSVVDGDFKRIYEKKLNTVSDLSIDELDITTKSNVSYNYSIELCDTNTPDREIIERKVITNVKCYFEGLFVGDNSKQYMAPLNCSTNTSRNTQVNYVNTLSGRTPYRVSNSNLNYTTGNSSGLFLKLDGNNNPIASNNITYMQEVIDYLSDGNSKVIKTSDGGMWYVSIDGKVDLADNERYIGSNTISFSWTEVGDVPILKVVS